MFVVAAILFAMVSLYDFLLNIRLFINHPSVLMYV